MSRLEERALEKLRAALGEDASPFGKTDMEKEAKKILAALDSGVGL